MTKLNRLAEYEAELKRAKELHAKTVEEQWETSYYALEAKKLVHHWHAKVENEKKRIADEKQLRLWWHGRSDT